MIIQFIIFLVARIVRKFNIQNIYSTICLVLRVYNLPSFFFQFAKGLAQNLSMKPYTIQFPACWQQHNSIVHIKKENLPLSFLTNLRFVFDHHENYIGQIPLTCFYMNCRLHLQLSQYTKKSQEYQRQSFCFCSNKKKNYIYLKFIVICFI